MNIAIIGSGIAGLTCAWRLAGHHQVTLFEAGATPGGHTATVDVSTPQGTYAIDTGFIVYNDRTYPRFMGLLSELGISGQKTQMSFSVHNPATGLEYNGHTLTSLFAQRWTGRWTRTPRCKRFWNSTASRRFLRATTFCRWGPPSGPRRCRR